MKIFYTVLVVFLFISCTQEVEKNDKTVKPVLSGEIVVSEFQEIIDSAHLKGAILIYDLEEDKYFSNDFEWAKMGHLPASTFKIANSIIGLETGVVENDSTLFKWNGEARSFPIWEQNLVFRDAFHFSCVPCYQELAREIGLNRIHDYLNKLEFGYMKVDSTNIDLFWLEGASRINQFQEIDFLRRLYQSELPIAKRTENIMKRMMVIEKTDSYQLSGKTGWSITEGISNGWFVGYIESHEKVYFFATNIEPKDQFDMNLFPMIRKDVTHKAFEQMDIK